MGLRCFPSVSLSFCLLRPKFLVKDFGNLNQYSSLKFFEAVKNNRQQIIYTSRTGKNLKAYTIVIIILYVVYYVVKQ